MASLRARWPFVLALAALLLGAWMRFAGGAWGAPFLLHVDEFAYNFHAAVRAEHHRHREGWWRPEIISYGALPMRAFVAARNLAFGDRIARAALARSPTADDYLRNGWGFDPGARDRYHWPSVARVMRGLSALLHLLAAVFAWRAAARLWGERAGAFTAVFAAVAPALVQHAHYYTPEAFLTLGVSLLLYSSVRVAQRGAWGDFALAAVAMVLVASSKVTSAPACALVGVAAWVHARSRQGASPTKAALSTLENGRLWAAAVLAVLAWCWLNPAAVRHAEWYFSTSTHFSPLQQVEEYRWGARLPDWANFFVGRGRTYFLRRVLPDAMGVGAFALAVLGALWTSFVERGARRLPALLAGLTLAPLCFTQLQTVRYVVPAIPVLAVCAGRLCDLALGYALDARVRWQRIVAVAGAALAGVALLHTTALGVAQTRVYRGTDNRVAAARWLRSHARTGDRVIIEDHPCYSPPLGNEWGEGEEVGARRVAYERLWAGGEDPNALRPWMSGARYVVLNDWYMRLVDVAEERRRHPGRWGFYAGVRARGAPEGFRRVARFDEGPGVLGWRVDERESEILSVAFDHLGMTVYERMQGR